MSLLRETFGDVSSFTDAVVGNSVATEVTTNQVHFIQPAGACEPAYSVGAGVHGEIKLTGSYLVGAPGYLYVTINGSNYKIALEPWTPPACPPALEGQHYDWASLLESASEESSAKMQFP